MSYKIHFPKLGKTIEARPGQSILDAALDNDIPLQHACGGYCACTTCHVQLVEGQANVSQMEEDEEDRLETKPNRTDRSRLACQTKVNGDITVEIPS